MRRAMVTRTVTIYNNYIGHIEDGGLVHDLVDPTYKPYTKTQINKLAQMGKVLYKVETEDKILGITIEKFIEIAQEVKR